MTQADKDRVVRFRKAYKEESLSMVDKEILAYINELKAQKQEVDRHFEEKCEGVYQW